MTPYITAGAGFLLAVLWFDLMFDVQVLRHGKGELPGEVLDSITGYYGRVTGGARPMSMLIAVVMLASLTALVVQLVRDEVPTWASVVSLALTALGVGLAATVTVPNGTRLGTRRDDAAGQSRLARAVLRDHLIEVVAIAAVLVLQLSL